MQAYELFKHPEQGYVAVKRGFSWPGFFFVVWWALIKRLWLVGAGLFVASVIVGMLFLAQSLTSPFFNFGITLFFQLLTGFKGNTWRARNLQDRGYQFVGAIKARNPQDAVAKFTAAGGVIPVELKALKPPPGFFSMPPVFQRLAAIITLTWKAAFRYRLFWVLAGLLLVAVVGLPLLLKDDGTASGFTQILLTYTLGAVTTLLGICTLWLACGTLARDIEDCSMQVVAVKPIPRWQIWLGKWLGLMSINAVLLLLAGVSIYGLLTWRAQGLPLKEQFRLRNEILVARDSAREDKLDKYIEEYTDKAFAERVKKVGLGGLDPDAARKQIREQVKAMYELVPPDGVRPWIIHLGAAKDHLRDQPLYLRVKFNSAQYNGAETFKAGWRIGVPGKSELWQSDIMSLAPDTYHEFPIPANLFDDKGDLTIQFANVNESALIFPLGDGLEVLYRQGGFALNFARGLGIILCWMALLATLGLAAASYLSFPVAAFCSVAILIMGLFSGTMANVVKEGTVMGMDEENGIVGHSVLDAVVVPLFRGMLTLIDMVQQYSPVDSLSTGRSITWEQLGLAFSQIVLLLGGILAVAGIFIFYKRELATAQGTNG